MRFPRMTTRRWMAVAGIVALMIWGGRLAWRWQHFQALARYEMSLVEEAAEGEQHFLRPIPFFQKMIAQNDREIDKLRRQNDPRLPDDLEREQIDSQIKLYESMNQMHREKLEHQRRAAKKCADIRSHHEALVRKYRAAAIHPWGAN